MQTARRAPRLRRSEAMRAPPSPPLPPGWGAGEPRSVSRRQAPPVGAPRGSARAHMGGRVACALVRCICARRCALAANARLMRTAASRSRHAATPLPPPSVCAGVCFQDGWTGFIIAAEKGHVEVIKLLLDKGADVNQATKVSVCVCVCVCARARARVFVCVCVCAALIPTIYIICRMDVNLQIFRAGPHPRVPQ